MSVAADKVSRLAAARKVIARETARQKKQNPNRDPTIFIAGERPDLIANIRIQTGNRVIDKMLGGGLPRGMMTEFVGAPGCGKTSAALMAAAAVQRAGGLVSWQNFEGIFPIDQALFHGVDLDELILIQHAPTAEASFNQLIDLLWDDAIDAPSRLLDLMIADSVAAFVPAQEAANIKEKGLEGMTVGVQARFTSKAWRYLTGTGMIDRSAMLLINQLRTQISATGMSSKAGTGGMAEAYYPKASLEFYAPKSERLKRKVTKPFVGMIEEVYGHNVQLTVNKNNTGRGDYTGNRDEYTVLYGIGVDQAAPLFRDGLDAGVITNPSSSYYVLPLPDGTTEKINGKDNVLRRLREDSGLFSHLEGLIAMGESAESRADEAIALPIAAAEPETEVALLVTGEPASLPLTPADDTPMTVESPSSVVEEGEAPDATLFDE